MPQQAYVQVLKHILKILRIRSGEPSQHARLKRKGAAPNKQKLPFSQVVDKSKPLSIYHRWWLKGKAKLSLRIQVNE
jgi:hypothetical protein